jgi:hypothetical protein
MVWLMIKDFVVSRKMLEFAYVWLERRKRISFTGDLTKLLLRVAM